MATVRELHYQFKLRMDRVDSLSSPDFNVAEIDYLLNEAQLVFIKQRMSPNSNPKGKGFEQSQKRIDDLSSLVIKYPQQPLITPIEVVSGVYELPLVLLDFQYLHFVSGWVTMTVNNCEKKVLLKIMQHDDYLEAIKDPFNSAHEEFVPCNFGRANDLSTPALFLYSSFPITSVAVEYIKYPAKVSMGTYTYINGNTYPLQTLETPEHTHSEIVDIAAQIAALDAMSPEYIQLKSIKLNIQE